MLISRDKEAKKSSQRYWGFRYYNKNEDADLPGAKLEGQIVDVEFQKEIT